MREPIDHLEGNPEAQEVRERYREIVRAMGAHDEKFAVRFEIKLDPFTGECILLVTSSLGTSEADMNICRLATALITGITGARPKEDGQ